MTSLISDGDNFASFKACLQGATTLSTKSETNCSKFALVKVIFKCLGPEESAVINGRFISVCFEDDNSFLAFSADSFNLCKAIGSFLRSMPSFFLNSSASQSTTFWSKSSPPNLPSPLLAFTSILWPSSFNISRIEISNVPPPRSNTATFSSFFLSKP